jgi:thioredoxin 1
MANIIEVNTENFEAEVLKSDIPVLVDYWAEWCAPCRAFMPIIEKVSEASNGKYKVVKLNVDNAHQIAAQYKVKTIPTLILFKNGVPVQTQIGRTAIENVMKMVSEDEKV